MKALSLNHLARIFGALFCLLGLVAGGMALRPPLSLAPVLWPTQVSTIFLLVVSVALLRAAYLACFRWSPLALRHLLGIVFFFFTVWLLTNSRSWILLALCYALFRFTTSILSRYIFPPSNGVSATTPN